MNRFSTVTSASVGSLVLKGLQGWLLTRGVGLSRVPFASGDTLYVWTHLLITPFARYPSYRVTGIYKVQIEDAARLRRCDSSSLVSETIFRLVFQCSRSIFVHSSCRLFNNANCEIKSSRDRWPFVKKRGVVFKNCKIYIGCACLVSVAEDLPRGVSAIFGLGGSNKRFNLCHCVVMLACVQIE